jgi:hypothetical protein
MLLLEYQGHESLHLKGQFVPSLSLEQRVTALEKELAALKESQQDTRRKKDWRRTVGMFTDNPEMKELLAEAMKLREADRSAAHPQL